MRKYKNEAEVKAFVHETLFGSRDRALAAALERADYAEKRAREIASHLVFQLNENGCGCESITDGGWTCPAHEALKGNRPIRSKPDDKS